MPVVADEVRLFETKGNYADVKADLANAIVNKGLVNDYNGNIGAMLSRTGADVGSTKAIYKSAEYLTFCSAKLSRAMMEADPANMAFCPFVVFVYEPADKPGVVVVGYRRPQAEKGNDATKKVLGEVAAMLESIAKEATK
jgi:uncharacterized protein (DUF302 family)